MTLYKLVNCNLFKDNIPTHFIHYQSLITDGIHHIFGIRATSTISKYLFLVFICTDNLFESELDLCEVCGECKEGGVELFLLRLQALQLTTVPV